MRVLTARSRSFTLIFVAIILISGGTVMLSDALLSIDDKDPPFRQSHADRTDDPYRALAGIGAILLGGYFLFRGGRVSNH